MNRGRISFIALIMGLSCTFATYADSVDDIASENIPYYIEIDKSDRALRVKYNGEVFREFDAASGRGGPGNKLRLGDNRTPVGIYRIVGFNERSKFHLFMRLNYPNVGDAFNGLKNKIISKREFDTIVDALRAGRLPPQDTRLGGAIGIHGVGEQTDKQLKIHNNLNWTEGCVALTNEEIVELRSYVAVGTEVVIQE